MVNQMMEPFDFQLIMFQKGAEELEKKIANLTSNLIQIKTAAIGIWTAIIGWSFSIKLYPVILVSYIVIISFWFLEALYWRVQFFCMKKASILTEYLNNQELLNNSFESQSIPDGLVYPLYPSRGETQIPIVKALFAPSIYIFYGLLLVTTTVILMITISIR